MSTPANNVARESILASIRENLAASAPFDAVHDEHRKVHTNQTYAPSKSNDRQPVSLTELFRKNLVSIGGNCLVVNDSLAAARAVQEIIEKISPQRIALSDSPQLKDLPASITTDTEVLTNAASAELFDCDIGITGAQWAIAETGTLVLESEREYHRLTSLIPPVHICLLPARCIRQTMGEILEVLQQEGHENMSRAITFITGPSRTSDIELTLAIGVHGPRELHVIVLDNA